MKIYNRINNGPAEVRDDLARELLKKEVWDSAPTPSSGRGQASVDTLKGAGTTGKAIVRSEDAESFWKVVGRAQISGPSVHAAVEKRTPVDADEIPLIDSGAGWDLKRLSFASLKAWFSTAVVTLTNKTLDKPTITGGKFDNVTGATLVGTNFEAVGTPKKVSALGHSSVTQASASVFPSFQNALSFHNLRGGTTSVTINGKPDNTNIDVVFGPNSDKATINTIKAVNDVVVIEIDTSAYRKNPTPGHLTLPIIGCEGRSTGFAKSVKIEVYEGSKWIVIGEATNAQGQYAAFHNGVTQKIRWTFTDFPNPTTFQIVSLFAVPLYDGDAGYSGFLPRSGGALYGTASSPPTLSTPAGVPLRINAKDIEFGEGIPATRLVAAPASASAPGESGSFALSSDETSLFVYAPKAKLWKKLALTSF